ncbi:MAG: ABC1 kinase family protein [Planctomycetota bacterium]
MKRAIPSIPQLYRNLRRWTEILAVLSKYGLADWLSRTQLDFIKDRLRAADGEVLARLSTEARIRMALTELGPTFIKFGQLISTRPDLIGPDLAEELSQLQTQTPHDDFEEIRAVVEQDQGRPLEMIFEYFEEQPMASASIGQVHAARLLDGREVVVKVRHPGIEQVIDTDLDILSGLAHLAERLEDFRNYQPRQIVQDMSRMMRRELDFRRELRNLVQFRSMFRKDQSVSIPQPYPKFSSERMLTMERIRGRKLSECAEHGLSTEELDALARKGANLYMRMIFDEGFFHADPHPGNILLVADNRFALLDFGMVGRISEKLREEIESMLVAIVTRDVGLLVAFVRRIGRCPANLNETALSSDVAEFLGQYATQSAANFNMAGALNDFMAIVRSHNITLPSEVSLLIKVLVTLEGTGQLLSPQFSLMEIMKPWQRLMIVKRLSPTRQLRKARRFYMQVEQLVDDLPQRVSNILDQVQAGRFDIHLDHRRLGPTVNRLVLGMLTSALFMGSSLMLSYKVPPLWFADRGPWGIHDLSLLGLTGCIVSIMLGFRLVWAIRKSGNLDQPDTHE